MAEVTLTACAAFQNRTELRSPDIFIDVRDDLTLASFAAFDGRSPEVMTAIKTAYGVDLPQRRGGRDLETELKPLLADMAAVVDQTDARAVMRVSGSRARDVLAKGVPLDLHAREFKPNHVAITHASHIAVLLWQIDDGPTYEIAMFRSFAQSFADWLMHSAAEYTGG